ncbi:MAG: hypothetical protein ACK4SM_02125 [Aquificaceae bacterium]
MKDSLLELYRKRARQFFYAFLSFLTIVFLASIATYPFFKLSLTKEFVAYLNLLVLLLGTFFLPLSLFLRRRFFPVLTEKDPYWSYTATRGYFWSFIVCGAPFLLAFLMYIIFAEVFTLVLGYALSLMGLVLIKPNKEDIL